MTKQDWELAGMKSKGGNEGAGDSWLPSYWLNCTEKVQQHQLTVAPRDIALNTRLNCESVSQMIGWKRWKG